MSMTPELIHAGITCIEGPPPRQYGGMAARAAKPGAAPTPWDDRFHVKVSKDNVTLHPTHREYFSTGSSLDRLTSSQWRQLQR